MKSDDRRGRPAVRTAALWAMIASAAFAPIFHGSVSGWPLWALTAATGAVAALAALAGGMRGPANGVAAPRPANAMFRASALMAGAFVVLVFVQAVPLGSWIAPLRFGPLAGMGVQESMMPEALSVYPGATRVSWVLLVAAAVPAFAAWAAIRRKEDLFAASGALVVVGGLAGFHGLLDYVSQGALYPAGAPGGRAAGTFVNPNHFAAFIGMLIPLSMSLTALKSRSWKRPGEEGLARSLFSLARDVSRRWWKILTCLAFLSMVLAVVFSGSRMGIAAAGAGVGVFIFLVFVIRRRDAGFGFLGVGLAVMILASIGVAVWIGLEPVMRRFEGMEPSFAQRVQIWSDALGIAADFPILGTGLGTFPHVFPAYQSADLKGGFSFPHSEYAHVLAETGFAGFAIAMAAALLWAAGFLRRFIPADVRTDRLVVAAGAFAGAFTMVLNCGTELCLRIPANYFVLSLLAGAAAAALDGSVKVRKDPGSGRRAGGSTAAA